MNIYLAARYSRREELCAYAETLRGLGFTVTSRWIDGSHQSPDETENAAALALKRQWAGDDLEDIDDASVLVAFTEEPRTGATRGGRHVELGYALGRRMPVVIVGPVENVFCSIESIYRFDEFGEGVHALLSWLEKWRAQYWARSIDECPPPGTPPDSIEGLR